MKRSLLFFCAILLALACFSQETADFNGKRYEKKANHTWFDVETGFEVDSTVITIKLKPNKQAEDLNKIGKIIRQNHLGYIDINISEKGSFFKQLHLLSNNPDILTLDINTIGNYNTFLTLSPNDPGLSSQWYLGRIRAFDAWDIVTGGSCVNIGVLDSGVDWSHNDLGLGGDTYQNIWLNPGEDTWTNPSNPSTGNGIDDDIDGLIDNWKGWNYWNNSNDVRTTNAHGTQVAGIISAKTNNGVGIAGVAGGNNQQGVNILPICIGVLAPNASVLDDAIIHAVDKGVQVIQISASVGSTIAINDAIQYATDKGVVVVCAAGNDNGPLSFPANNVNTISVGATNQIDQRATFSNYGNNLDLAAPGVDIYSTYLNNLYASADGTSFAAPIVSATVGLMLSVDPSLSPTQVRNILTSTADKVGGYTYITGRSNELGYGRLNTFAAVQAVTTPITGPASFCTSGSYSISGLPTGATVTGWSANPSYAVSFSGSGSTVTVTKASIFSGQVTLSATITGPCGSYTVFRNVQVGMQKPDNPTVWYDALSNIIEVSTNAVPGATSYEFYVNGVLVITTPSTLFHLPASGYCGGTYYFGVKAVGPCGTSEEARTLARITCPSPFAVFPNPANESLTISAVEGENVAAKRAASPPVAEFHVKLFDQQGRMLREAKSKDGFVKFDTHQLNEGTYFLHITQGKETIKRQVVIKH